MGQPREYTRWRQVADSLDADILGAKIGIRVVPSAGVVHVIHSGVSELTPDEARLYGVRLIEAAALADGERAIRRPREEWKDGDTADD